jgi:hypothetical protein
MTYNPSSPAGSPQRSTLVAIFDDRRAAEQAVDDLERAGFRAEDIGFAIRGSEAVRGGMITDAEGTKDGKGAAVGAATGAGLGALVGAAVAVLIPGVGPVVAAGILTSALGGALAGTAVGGIFGAFVGLGVSEHEAKFLETEFQSGKAIVVVRGGARGPEADAILRRHGGYDVQTRRAGDEPIPTKGAFSQP